MIILSFDVESTGLDTLNDRIIEIGAVLWSSTFKKCVDNFGPLVKSDKPVTSEITKITGVTQQMLDRFGMKQEDAFDVLLDLIEECDAVAGHNVSRFDKAILESWARRLNKSIPEKLWIDTMIDIKGHEGKKLSYLAADHGILNLFPHSAMADCQTVLAVIDKYDINDIVVRSKTPTVVIQSKAPRSQNDLVKKAKFRWNPNFKIWWRPVKENDVEELQNSVAFEIGFADKSLTLDMLNS